MENTVPHSASNLQVVTRRHIQIQRCSRGSCFSLAPCYHFITKKTHSFSMSMGNQRFFHKYLQLQRIATRTVMSFNAAGW
ncbi:hypothetical protein EZJ58_1211 [Sodalis ligni]|jgi:hypothetical protein|uniref:Uncharacterized protein n=1 Tax=Sodalis ligni TaxID=2697027 RepID=A0A4R1N7L9_9GAMM|nr:hypothetical protein EZJ58_1211 [Sodalis ligni]